ncbi:MAG: ribonuclease Z [Deltaproteobacteria bacterium]|nr:MAG: ribonuclease Z [Deltaproteobacteria bacterium]
MSELKITFLGTGSARPTPQRSVACVALSLGGEAVLFDCGEGAQLQATRAGFKPSRLHAVCITHFHGDHINGLPGFIGTMGLNGHRDRVALVSPRGLRRYLQVLRELSILHPAFPLDLHDAAQDVPFATDDWRIESFPLDHRLPCHGYLFREKDLPGRFDLEHAIALGIPRGPLFGKLQRGESVRLDDGRTISPEQVLGLPRRGRSVAYVTDTRPCSHLVEAVRGVDVLIHEATYTHEFADLANERGHSTAVQAAEVARDAGVGRLILTHVSTRYVRARPLLREAQAVFPNTVVARDLDVFDVPVHD